MSSFGHKNKAKHNSVLDFSDAGQLRRSSIGGGSSKSSHGAEIRVNVAAADSNRAPAQILPTQNNKDNKFSPAVISKRGNPFTK